MPRFCASTVLKHTVAPHTSMRQGKARFPNEVGGGHFHIMPLCWTANKPRSARSMATATGHGASGPLSMCLGTPTPATKATAYRNVARKIAYAIAPYSSASKRDMDNVAGHELTEGETTLFGINFGVITDIQTAPNGNLFVVSLLDGRVYEIYRD